MRAQAVAQLALIRREVLWRFAVANPKLLHWLARASLGHATRLSNGLFQLITLAASQ